MEKKIGKAKVKVRCVNTETNKVDFFYEEVCSNKWWQKTTKFVPQPIEESKPSIINTQTSESASVKPEETTGQADAGSITEPKVKTKKQDGSN